MDDAMDGIGRHVAAQQAVRQRRIIATAVDARALAQEVAADHAAVQLGDDGIEAGVTEQPGQRPFATSADGKSGRKPCAVHTVLKAL
jgi:hypothetical protein